MSCCKIRTQTITCLSIDFKRAGCLEEEVGLRKVGDFTKEGETVVTKQKPA